MARTDRIDATLAKRGLAPPPGFTPVPGPIHANLQRVFACALDRDGPLKASFPGGWEVWLYQPSLGGLSGRSRKWLPLGHYDGGNYTVFTFDFGAPDPAIYRFDHEDFDEADDGPRSWIRLTASLSSFVAALRPQEVPKGAVPDVAAVTLPLGFAARHVVLATGRLLAAGDRVVKVFERGEGDVWTERFVASLPGDPQVAAFDGEGWVLALPDAILAGRRSATGWDAPVAIPLPDPGRCKSAAICDGRVAFGVPDAVVVFDRAASGWVHRATLPSDGPYGVAVSIDREWLAVGHKGGMTVYDRELVPAPLPALAPLYPGHWIYAIYEVAIGDGWVFGAYRTDGTHLRDGRATGQERSDSGTIFALRCTPDGWAGPQLVKHEPPGVNERLGRRLQCRSGLLLATTCHQLLDRQRAVGFALDPAGIWRQVFEGADVEGSEYSDFVAVGDHLVATQPPDRQSLVLTPVSPASPRTVAPSRVTVLEPEHDRDRLRSQELGKGLGAGGRWAVTREGDVAVVYALTDGPTTCVARVSQPPPGSHGATWAVAGDDFAYVTTGLVGAWVGTLIRSGTGWVEGPRLCDLGGDPPDHILAADGDVVAFLTHPAHRAPHTLHVWRRSDGGWAEQARVDLGLEIRDLAIDAAHRRLAWSSSTQGVAAVLELEGLAEIGRLAPARPAKAFGQAIALSRGEAIVGSSVGAHVFGPAEGGFVERQLLKLARRKYEFADDAVLANDDLLVVTSSTKGRGELNPGALVAYRRSDKGWRAVVELPGVMTGISGFHSHACAALAGDHLLLGFPSRFGRRGCVEDVVLPR